MVTNTYRAGLKLTTHPFNHRFLSARERLASGLCVGVVWWRWHDCSASLMLLDYSISRVPPLSQLILLLCIAGGFYCVRLWASRNFTESWMFAWRDREKSQSSLNVGRLEVCEIILIFKRRALLIHEIARKYFITKSSTTSACDSIFHEEIEKLTNFITRFSVGSSLDV